MRRKYNLNFNYLIADFVARLSVGLLRKLRFVRIVKTKIALRLLRILYKQGVIRSFRIEDNFIAVYLKFQNGQPIGKFSIVSRPGKRCYWNLGFLAKNFNMLIFQVFI